MRSRGITIDDIEQAALDSSVPLSDTLRKVIALGGRSGSAALRDWASLELNGYAGTGRELPDHRRAGAVIQVDALTGNRHVTGQQMSPSQFPDPVRDLIREYVPLGQSMGEIEALLDQAKRNGGAIKLSIPHAADVAALWDQQIGDPCQSVIAIYWTLSGTVIAGLLDRVRSTLVELIAEMRAAMPAREDVPSANAATNAVLVVIEGKARDVNVYANQSAGSEQSAPLAEPERHVIRQPTISALILGAVAVGAACVGAAVVLLVVR